MTQSAPGVDWAELRADWEENKTSFRKLAEKYGVSQQAISKHAKKENWYEGRTDIVIRKSRGPNWKKLVLDTKVADYGDAANINIPKLADYPKVLVEILDAIEAGATDKIASQAAGIDPERWKVWLKNDKRLKELTHWARSIRAQRRVRVIDDAADKGDWRASSYMLERAPDTREDFKKPEDEAGAIQIVLNMPRGNLSTTKTVIEGELDAEDRPQLRAEPEAETPP